MVITASRPRADGRALLR